MSFETKCSLSKNASFALCLKQLLTYSHKFKVEVLNYFAINQLTTAQLSNAHSQRWICWSLHILSSFGKGPIASQITIIQNSNCAPIVDIYAFPVLVFSNSRKKFLSPKALLSFSGNWIECEKMMIKISVYMFSQFYLFPVIR